MTLTKRNWFQRRFDAWLTKRLPRVEEIQLNRKRIFIFPSRAGFAYLLLVTLLWLVATNYENNVVFAFAALMAALLVITIFHSYTNLSGIKLQINSVGNGFPDEKVRVTLTVSQQRGRHRDDIWLRFSGGEPQRVTLHNGSLETVAELYIGTHKRGRLQTSRLTVESFFPLGLMRVWTQVLLEGEGVVYPRPLEVEFSTPGGATDNSSPKEDVPGSEDFAGLRAYYPGESLNRIAWKQAARGLGLLSKQFSDSHANSQWLDWDNYPGLDRESRLSGLCEQVLKASRGEAPYGLRLPRQNSVLGHGAAHRDRLLRMLGLFESGG